MDAVADDYDINLIVARLRDDECGLQGSVRLAAQMSGARWAAHEASFAALAKLNDDNPGSLWDLSIELDFEPSLYLSLPDLEILSANGEHSRAAARAFVRGALGIWHRVREQMKTRGLGRSR